MFGNRSLKMGFLFSNAIAFSNLNVIANECSAVAVKEGYTPIATAQDLSLLHYNEGGIFVLTADIDLSNQAFVPINDFAGTLLGCNYSIRNLVINMPNADYVGLFSKLHGGRVKDLNIENASIMGRYYVGGLAGTALGFDVSLHIQNVSISNSRIQGRQFVGGVAGESNFVRSRNLFYHGKIFQVFPSSLSSPVGGGVGGVFGIMNGGETLFARTEGVIQAVEGVGGIVGMLQYSGTVRQSLSNSDLIGITRTLFGDTGGWVQKANAVGGIVGLADHSSSIRESASMGTIRLDSIHHGAFPPPVMWMTAGASRVGGILGGYIARHPSKVEISDSYSLAHIQNDGILGRITDSGGLVGGSMNNDSRISLTRVFYAGPQSNIKGLRPVVGYQSNIQSGFFTLSQAYYDSETSGLGHCPYGAMGLLTSQMQDPSHFVSWANFGWELQLGSYPQRLELID